jgi:hypothetical protein
MDSLGEIADRIDRTLVGMRFVVFAFARVGAGMIAAVLVGVLLFAGSALAARGHVFSMSFGSEGSGPGQLKEPVGVVVNEAEGPRYDVAKRRPHWAARWGHRRSLAACAGWLPL